MISFDEIPNKVPRETQSLGMDIWPSLGTNCEVNLFFKDYASAEGWLGEGYFMIWSRDEIVSLQQVIMQTYPEKYHFFASDGGGTQFGFIEDGSKILYFSAPDIGTVEDIRILGNWDEFLRCIRESDYI